MALIQTESQPCVTIIKTNVDDGEGGQTTTYVDDTSFDAVLAPADNADMKILADREVSARVFRVFYPNSITLDLNAIFKTLDDGQCYKIIRSGFKSATVATVQRSLAYAERWEVPPDEYSE